MLQVCFFQNSVCAFKSSGSVTSTGLPLMAWLFHSHSTSYQKGMVASTTRVILPAKIQSMKDEDIEPEGHYIEPDEDPGRMQINKLALALTRDIMGELPEATTQAILALFPNLPQDAHALLVRLLSIPPTDGIEMSDAEIYTLYIAYDVMGKILTSDYKDFAMTPFEADGPMSEEEKNYIYKTLVMSIETVFEDTESYAADCDCLEELPDIKRRIMLLPSFD